MHSGRTNSPQNVSSGRRCRLVPVYWFNLDFDALGRGYCPAGDTPAPAMLMPGLAGFCQKVEKTIFFHGKNRTGKNTLCRQK